MNNLTYKFKCPECDQRIEADIAFSLRFIQCPSCKTDFISPNSDAASEMMHRLDQFNYHFVSDQLVYIFHTISGYLGSKIHSDRSLADLIVFSGWTIQMAIRICKPNSDIKSITQRVIQITSSYLEYRLSNYHGTSTSKVYSSDSWTVTATKFYGYDQLFLSTNNVEDPLVMTLLVNSLFSELGILSDADDSSYKSFKIRYENIVANLKQEITMG